MAARRLSRKSRFFLFKIYALSSLVRWYNVLIISLGLYLSALYLFNIGVPHLEVLSDYRLHFEIFSLALFIMSGYIINAFYDLEKDLINNPNKAIFDRLISKEFSFYTYFFFNALAALLSLFVSWPVFLTNVFFSFALWFYSHKMRKKPFMGELAASILTVLPFISLSIYYQFTNRTILVYFVFLGCLIFTREVVKKMVGMKGDILLGDKSIPIVFGIKKTKRLIVTIMALSFVLCLPLFYLIRSPFVHTFLIAFILSMIVTFTLIVRDQDKTYMRINTIYKALLILAILCIPFIFA